MSIKEEIKNIISGDVADDAETLQKYSRDASLFEIKPAVVVWPRNAEDIKSMVRFAADRRKAGQNISLTVRSGGSDMTGGPLSESIVIDPTRYMNKIKEIADGHAVVEPGLYYRDFEPETLKQNLVMPSFPASRELATVGGMVSNNAGGEETLYYGKTENFVAELKVVLADGEEYVIKRLADEQLQEKLKLQNFEGDVYRKFHELILKNEDVIAKAKPRVSKNSSGYYLWNVKQQSFFDLTRLITGSQGTLGIITEIKFRLINPRAYKRLLVVFLNDLSNLSSIVNKLLEFKPETMESYDDNTLRLAIRFFPQFVKRLKTNFFSLAIKFIPEFLMVLRGGLPKFVLTAEFASDDKESADRAAEQANSAMQALSLRTRITKDESEADKYRIIRRESFNLLRNKIKDRQTAPFIDDIVVRPEYLPEFLPKLEKILKDYPDLIYTVAGHMGDGNFHIIPLMDLSDPKTPEILGSLSQKVYNLVFAYHGSMSAEHNDGLVRGPFMKQMFGAEVYGLFEQTKEIFDPLHIFNPGKKIGVDWDYAMAHLKRG